MVSLSRTELQALAVRADELRATVYLPLNQTHPEAGDDVARLHESLIEAERLLGEHGMSPGEAQDFLRSAQRVEQSSDFRSGRRGATLAILASRESIQTELLPYVCPHTVDVGHKWYMAPLLRLLTWPAEFHLLTLSETRVKLYRGSREGLIPVDLPVFLPQSMDDWLDRQESEATRPPRLDMTLVPPSAESAAACGEISCSKDEGDRLHKYVRELAEGAEQYVVLDPLPLVLAAEAALYPVFREAYGGIGLTESGIYGCPDALTPTELHEQAVRLVETQYEQEQRAACNRFQKIAQMADVSRRLEEIVPAACQGRVNSIIAAFGHRIWGTWDPERQRAVVREGQAVRRPGEIDLLDLALQKTLQHGGDIRVVSSQFVPAEGAVAAVLRW